MSKIAQYIRMIADKGDEVYSIFCKITSVDKVNNKCNVKPIRNEDSKIELTEVQLGSKIDNDNDYIIYPEVNSVVLITWISKQDAFISLYGDIDEIVMKPNNDILLNPNGKVSIANDIEDLKTIIDDLLTGIKSITVTSSPTGGVTTTPINFAVFDALSIRLGNLLK